MRNDELNNIEAIIFDIDGVLIDVKQSYRMAIEKTIQYFVKKESSVIQRDIEKLKKTPGFNNDWDVTYTLIKLYKSNRKPSPKTLPLNILTKSSPLYIRIKNIFQTYYLGEKLYFKCYGKKPLIQNVNGLIDNESLLMNPSTMKNLSSRYVIGVVTSRPRFEALYIFRKFKLLGTFIKTKNIIALEDCAKQKPDPTPIELCKKRLMTESAIYIGDTINDTIAAEKASIPSINIGINDRSRYSIQNVNELELILSKKLFKSTSVSSRISELSRATKETSIEIALDLDNNQNTRIVTPIGFLNHMLELFAFHGRFSLQINAKGDTYVDDHHVVEDIGIVLGQTFLQAIGDKKGINRYGFFMLPMDEVLTTAVFDFAGRYAFQFDVSFKREKVGDLSTELIYDFWDAFAQNVKANLIIKSEYGKNDHHKIEGIFKGVAYAIRMACTIDISTMNQVKSTKGFL